MLKIDKYEKLKNELCRVVGKLTPHTKTNLGAELYAHGVFDLWEFLQFSDIRVSPQLEGVLKGIEVAVTPISPAISEEMEKRLREKEISLQIANLQSELAAIGKGEEATNSVHSEGGDSVYPGVGQGSHPAYYGATPPTD